MSEGPPRCPSHPDGHVTDARLPTTSERTWVCLICAKKLGPAPSREATWESGEIKASEARATFDLDDAFDLDNDPPTDPGRVA